MNIKLSKISLVFNSLSKNNSISNFYHGYYYFFQGMAGLPRKFPSPSPEDDEELDDEDVEDASCEELVVTGIPFVPNKVTVSFYSHCKYCKIKIYVEIFVSQK